MLSHTDFGIYFPSLYLVNFHKHILCLKTYCKTEITFKPFSNQARFQLDKIFLNWLNMLNNSNYFAMTVVCPSGKSQIFDDSRELQEWIYINI